MRYFLFLLYVVLGIVVAMAANQMGGLEVLPALGVGIALTLLMGQIHLFAQPVSNEDHDVRIAAVEQAQRDLYQRADVTEARVDATETTLKHEMTERRDALVAEMKQLEGLIERLAENFQSSEQNGKIASIAPEQDKLLREVRSALEQGRVDLHLQPIVSLPQRRVAFYEGLSRLRRPDGTLIMPAEFMDAARRARMLGVLDTLNLFRCVQIVRRLAERDRRIGIFCNISAASLDDDKVFPFFLDFMSENRDLSGAVIFELSADHFETRSRQMRENMDKLSAMGFRFSIDHTPSVGLDLPRLQDAGVRFCKVEGENLVDQLRNSEGPRPVSALNSRIAGDDVSAVFSRYGVTLIADRLEDEATVVELLEYDIPFAQGDVIGPARPIKASLMEETAPTPDFIRRLTSFG
ncbi:MAG: EAL domain-containing protein [Pseudomonadota bacterium]